MDAAPNEQPGLLQAAREFGTAGLRHVRARWALLAAESREAGRHVGVLAALGVGLALSLLIGYLFLAIGIGFLIAWLCHSASGVWVAVLFGAALFHAAVAGLLARALKARLPKPLFPVSRAEWKKDQP